MSEAAIEAEPRITHAIQSALPDGVKLDGLGHRLKKESSIKEKLTKFVREGLSLSDAKLKLKDSVRYTALLPHDKYVAKVKEMLDNLTNAGYVVSSFRNTWGSPSYQAINTNLTAPGGQELELQFHTQDSFDTKQANHTDYEVWRHPDTSSEEVSRLHDQMVERQAKLARPPGVIGMTYG